MSAVRTARQTEQRANRVAVDLDPETVERLDAIREEGESYDDVVRDLLSVVTAVDGTLVHPGDEAPLALAVE